MTRKANKSDKTFKKMGVGEGGLLTVYGTVVKTVYLVEASLLILMMHSVWSARCPLFDIKIIL